MTEEDAAKYCESVGAKSALPRIIKTGYSALGLVHYFTASDKEVRAWSVKKDTPAPKAAAVIHGDFEKHFISSEIYSFADFKEHGSDVAAVRAAGKVRMEGRKYEVQDGDVCYWKVWWRDGWERVHARARLPRPQPRIARPPLAARRSRAKVWHVVSLASASVAD